MLLLDYKGGGKKPIKQGFFATLLERRKREKRRESPNVKKDHHFHTVFWGLKNGQEVVPSFWAPTFQFLKSAKTPIFNVFPGKAGGSQMFLEKAMLERGQK